MASNTIPLLSRLRDMGDRTNRHNYSIGDYWNAVDEAADRIEGLMQDVRENDAVIDGLRDSLVAERAYIKKMDAVIDDEGIARSCINPLEDMRVAIRGLKFALAVAQQKAEAPLQVLRELVRLKALHDGIEDPRFRYGGDAWNLYPGGMDQWSADRDEYARCKPLAWEAARVVISERPVSAECLPDSECRLYCCCGDLIEGHSYESGHSAVSMHDWYCTGACEEPDLFDVDDTNV